MSRIAAGSAPAARPASRRSLAVAAGAHILHDGYSDVLYLLLPVWRAEFALGFAEVGLMRALYSAAMAGFQFPAGILAERLGGPKVLVLGTLLAAAGFGIAGSSGGIVALCLALLIGGIGASTQHPIASSLVARAYAGPQSRIALGTYNFSGDLGKMLFPAATAGLLALMPWRSAVEWLAAVGVATAVAIHMLLGRQRTRNGASPIAAAPLLSPDQASVPARGGFRILLAIGVIDSATRMGFLTFLPFLLAAKGAALPAVGLGLTLIFAGGAAGKLVCGYLGARLGVLRTVFLTEGLTALGIVVLLPLPLEWSLAVLPIIGVALNGTSSVLYGSVPELVPTDKQERAFSIFYTGTIGSGAVAPVLYGLFSDALGVNPMMALIAGVVLLTLPLAWILAPALARAQSRA